MELRPDYLYKIPLNLLTDFTTLNNLVQMVDFVTWTRSINGVRKESTLDHIYTDNDTLINVLMRLTVPLGVVSITPTKPKRAGEMYQEPLELFLSNIQFVLLSDT